MRLMVLLTLLYAGTLALAQDVQYNYDRDANFAAYKTYKWADGRRGMLANHRQGHSQSH